MYPAYRWTDSYPHHANSMNCTPSDNPRAKEVPFHMKMDPSTLNSPYQPWSYGGNYWYPVPQECHGCCNHNYYGGPYSFRPPYPHYPPPPPALHTHGFYPPFPGAYPAYSVPPPNYSVEQPRYDYDKNTHTPHHCCGCTRRDDDKKLRIEPEDPEVDKKTSDSLGPFQLKNYPYPIMWVPPGYMKNTETEAKEEEKYSHDPVSLKPLEPSKQGGNGEATRDQQGGNGYRLPFPIFWLPSKNNEVGKDINENNLDLATRNGSPFSGSDEKKRQPRKSDVDSGSEGESEMSTKHAVQKVIPVKQLGTEEEKESGSVEKVDNGTGGKPSTKTSKLPPVCLRIDPLPRKNSSRSPSPTDKGRSKGSPMDNAKSSQQQTQLPEGLKKSKEKQSKGNTKTVEVINGANKVETAGLIEPCEKAPRDLEIKDCGKANEGEKGIVQDQSGKGERCKAEKMLSAQEAALIIQSAYRGFEVRKSQPLTKLRQIAEVGKQVVELRNHIRDLESSSSSIRIDDKQKLIVGETIMSLLLKLDTIQGLHPIVRDVRKSVAKELVGLQEKLDSLTFVKSETPSEETTSITTPVMNPEDDAMQEKSDQAQAESGTAICENHEVEATESQDDGGAEARDINLEPQVELDTEQPVGDAIHDKSDQAQAQSDSNDEVVGENRDAEDTESQNDGVVEARDVKLEQPVELKSQRSSGELNDNQLQMLETRKPVDDATPEKSDQARAQTGSSLETVESGIGVCEHHEVEAIESQDDDGAEACDVNLDPQVELNTQHSTEELNDNQLQMLETEQPVDDATQETSNQAQTQFDSGVGNVVSSTGMCDHHEVESKESGDDGDVSQQSTGKLNSDQLQMSVETGQRIEVPAAASVEVEKDVSMDEPVDVKAELPKEDEFNGTHEEFGFDKEYQEPPKVDDVESPKEVSMEDLGGAPPLSPTGSHVSGGVDEKLMEENEKLRQAVEKLMKAGNEQLGVITELTGRVKDLERKLSRKKKMKVKKCRSRGSVLQDELRSCQV